MTRSQAELLLMSIENRHDTGAELITQMRRMGGDFYDLLLRDRDMIEKAAEINRQDLERFANYAPKPPATLRPANPQHQIPAPIKKAAET